MTYVATYIDVKRDAQAEAVTLIRRYCETTASENGSRWISAVQETFRPNRFVILEGWQDDTAQQAHDGAAHTSQFRARLNVIHNSPYDQRIHHEFAAGLESPKIDSPGAFHVVTHVDVPPPRKDETEKLLRDLAAESDKEAGNLRFDVFQQLAPRTNHFTVYAVWTDDRAFEAHELKPHTRQFREALGPLLGAPYDERLFKAL